MKRKKRLNRRQWMVLIAAICGVVLAAVYFLYQEYRQRQMVIRSNGNVQEIESGDVITYGGKKYRYNENLTNILFLGVDKTEEVQVQEYAGRNGQSDCMILLVMDEKEKTTELLQISRDSMVNLEIYSISGEFLTEMRGQIALQYAYGDGEKKSCRLTKEAVSKLLFGIKIDGCISLNIDGISAVVDALGGVEFTLNEDALEIDPSYEKGKKVTLDGEQAEKFVRYRDTGVVGSNNSRMDRQAQFLQALFSQVKAKAGDEPEIYDILIDSSAPYMVSDLTAEEMKALSGYGWNDMIEKVPGEVQTGEHDEYIVDDEKLQELLIKMFYNEVE